MSDSDRTSMPTELHRECWLMLPWLVTGRIAASDRQRFERHIAECAECRDELAQQRELCEHIRRDDAVMLAPQASLQKLMSRIDATRPAHSEEAQSVLGSPTAAPATAKSSRPRWLAIAAAVQAIAIAALLTLLLQQRAAEMNEPRFTTLSTTAPQPRGTLLRVVFSPQMTNAELQQLLRSVDATVVAGPTEAGVYSLQLSRASSTRDVGAVLAKVRANRHVVFAEHVTTEAAR
jgi:hypothetical protein